MKFVDYISKGQVKRGQKDFFLAKSLTGTADLDLRFLQSLKIDKTSARKIMTNYYDVLRSILEAMAALEGYKVYSHEAFTYFLKQKGEENLARKFDRFRKIRNGINYYGKDISAAEVKEHVKEMQEIITILRAKYLS